MHRRDLLRLAAALATSAFATSSEAQRPTALRRETIIVVGAGIAGLAAAARLASAGQQVIVLESRDRVGGRLWTSRKWADAPLDLGASWIHGVTKNPINQLAKQVGARRIATFYKNAIAYDTDGSVLSKARDRDIYKALAAQVRQALAKANQQDADVSMAAALAAGIDLAALAPERRDALDFLVNSAYEQEYGGDASKLSAWWFDQGEEFAGDDVLFPGGYDAIATYLAQGLDIRLQHAVQRIAYSGSGVSVETSQGSFTGDRVIVTLPLGVLQSGKIEFSPGLPRLTTQAINSLGMGTLNKAYLRFPRAFWPEQYDWMEYIAAEKGQWSEWISGFERYVGLPILLGFNAAAFGVEIEAWPDADIVASAMQTLRRIYGNGIPEPEDYQITRWTSDPHAYGSYSYYKVGSTPKMRAQLGKPVGQRLFFAGEATSTDHPATVHGACLTGHRAAKEALAA
jgi:monoamine oxidase